MSVRLMSEVFARYPSGGGEMLLALALADHANDDGSRVYPSVKALAEKTRQSERTVQYQLRSMQAAGWLILVGPGNGGRSMATEYRISPLWIKGADIAPFQKDAIDDTKGAISAPFNAPKGADIAPFTDQKGATRGTKGCNPRHKRVQPIAPANNHQEPSEPSRGEHTDADAPCLPPELLKDFLAVRKAKRAGPLTKTALAGLQREADKAGLTLADAVAACCELGWQSFNAGWFAARQAPSAAAPPQRGKAPAAESFRERDARLSREKWEKLTGRTHPDSPAAPAGVVVDLAPSPRRIEA